MPSNNQAPISRHFEASEIIMFSSDSRATGPLISPPAAETTTSVVTAITTTNLSKKWFYPTNMVSTKRRFSPCYFS